MSKSPGPKHSMTKRVPSDTGHSGDPIVVIKIGGSLIRSGDVGSTLKVIAKARVPAVLVCGGGAFADEVRRSQRVLGLGDKAAHRMAILAMHQSALALADLHASLVPVETLADLRLALRRGKVPVWLPLKMCDRDRDLAQDWSITSDGLAARLAERLGQADVILLKSCAVPVDAEPEALAIAGVVDPAFVEIVNRAGLEWRIFGPGQEQDFASRLLVQRQHWTQLGKPHEHAVHYRSPVRLRRATGRR